MDLDLRQLRYFVAVAEELSFTRAARRLHMAQPALSQAIRRLERQLGVTLFVRTSRMVALTTAGATLLAQSRSLLQDAEHVVRATQASASASANGIVVGVERATNRPLVGPAFAEFRARCPDGCVVSHHTDWITQVECVVDGTADVAFVLHPVSHEHVETVTLLTVPRAVVVPADHPLAERTAVSIGDLRDEILAFPAGAPAEWVDFWTAADRAVAPGLPRAPTVGRAEDSIALVLSGQTLVLGIAVQQDHYAGYPVRFVPISDVAPARIGLAWPRANAKPVVSIFVASALTAATRVAAELNERNGFRVDGPDARAVPQAVGVGVPPRRLHDRPRRRRPASPSAM